MLHQFGERIGAFATITSTYNRLRLKKICGSADAQETGRNYGNINIAVRIRMCYVWCCDAESECFACTSPARLSDTRSSCVDGNAADYGTEYAAKLEAELGTKHEAEHGTEREAELGTKHETGHGTEREAERGTKNEAKHSAEREAEFGTNCRANHRSKYGTIARAA